MEHAEVSTRREPCQQVYAEAFEGIATEVPGTRHHDLWGAVTVAPGAPDAVVDSIADVTALLDRSP